MGEVINIDGTQKRNTLKLSHKEKTCTNDEGVTSNLTVEDLFNFMEEQKTKRKLTNVEKACKKAESMILSMSREELEMLAFDRITDDILRGKIKLGEDYE